MSEFLAEYRAKYPEYNDIDDNQLVSALNQKYNAEAGANLSLEQFSSSIGYQVGITTEAKPPDIQQPMQQGIAQPVIDQEQQPIQQQEPSMLELIAFKLNNLGAGLGERAGELGGALLQTAATVSEGLSEGLEEQIPLGGFVWNDKDILPDYVSGEEYKKRDVKQVLEHGAQVLDKIDLGYQQQVGWQDVKDSFKKGGALSGSAYADVFEYAMESGIKSIPDMVASIYALPAYIFARSGEIGEERAINKGKEEADIVDIMEAAPFAAASAVLERIGAKGMTVDAKEELGKELLKRGIGEASKRVAKVGGKALTKEAATEAIQEGMIEYVGERFGTNAKMDLSEALDRAAAGAVAGGVFGGTVGAGTAAVNEIQFSPEKQLAKEIDAEVKAAEPAIKPEAEAAAIDAMAPENAQLVKTKRDEFSASKEFTDLAKAEQDKVVRVAVEADLAKAAPKPVTEEAQADQEVITPEEPQSVEKPVVTTEIEQKVITEPVTEEVRKPAKKEMPAKLEAKAARPEAEPVKPLFSESNRVTSFDKKGGSWNAIVNENPAIKNSKDGKVTVYRATIGDSIRVNDFVAANKDVATQHLDNLVDRGESGQIVTKEVNVGDLIMGNDATEFIYSPEQKQELPDKLEAKVARPRQVIKQTKTGFDFLGQTKARTNDVFSNQVKQPPKDAKSFADQQIETGSIEEAKVKQIDLNSVIPTQRFISEKNINEVAGIGANTDAELLKVGDDYYILDGHHRIAANIVNGEKSITARVVEYKESLPDKFESRKPSKAVKPVFDGKGQQEKLSEINKTGVVVSWSQEKNIIPQVDKYVKEQTKVDAEKEAANKVDEAVLNQNGSITYPQPKPDINTEQSLKAESEYKIADTKPVKPGQRIFNAPGHNYVGMFRSMGIPPRRNFVMIEDRKLLIPNKPQRIEPIMAKLIKITGRRIYFGKIKGKSSDGFYRPKTGEIRTRKKNDVEVLAHEMAHYLDVYSNEKLPNFQKLYKDKKYSDEVKALSYTDATNELQHIEGFAEFVRLWLTNSEQAMQRAPKFYDAFTNLLARDRKLLNPMRDMQDLMHKFYFQGADNLGKALIGQDLSFDQRFNQWAYRRDSRIRQQTIDKFHAARKIEQELTKKIGTVEESAWKQFRLANGGSEGISDYVMNYGTVNFDENGDLQKTGKSLHEVLEPVKSIELKPEHKGDDKIDVLMRYFAGRRALELHRQGRENLIPKETAMEWARLGKDYPVFESIHKEYQAFNNRMMDFYEASGMITKDGRKAMQSMNKDYVPFNRIRDQLTSGKNASNSFQKLKGGSANLNDLLVNIQDGITSNVRAALTNRAKQRLYQYISNSKDGAIFATHLAPDSRPVKVYMNEMESKIESILESSGIMIEGGVKLNDPSLLTFWQHGVKPQVNESGNIVDTVIINGKPKYYEVQDPLLQDMLLSMNPESYSLFMNSMFMVKNFFTRMITLGIEFMGANLVRDTLGASIISKNGFIPFYSSFNGMYSFITRDKHYQDFIRSGGGYSSRLESLSAETGARKRVKLKEFGVMDVPERLLTFVDNIASTFEYGTRIGEFKLAKKNHKSDMDAGFAGREISTDFSVLGANHFLTGYIRTVPFLNAMIQSQDRVFREAVILKKYDGNPTALAMKAFLGLTIPTLLLYMLNKDDEDYKQIPDYEKRTNWHVKIGDNEFLKIPRPYDVGFVYATMPELFFKYVEDDKGKEFADGMLWTLTQMYGIDGVPAAATGWWDITRNEKWTGAPVVPKGLSDVEATEQYTSYTSETFIRLGQALNMSPVKAEHVFKAYTGYLGGYVIWGTDHMLWDESKFGPKPDSKASDNVFLRRFLTPETRPSTASMEKFFDLKEKSDKVVATFKQKTDARRAIRQKTEGAGEFKDSNFYGLSAREKKVLFSLNDSMNKLIKLMYGKGGIKTAELKIKYDKNLTSKEKRDQLENLWQKRGDAFLQYYTQADKALQAAKKQSEQEK